MVEVQKVKPSPQSVLRNSRGQAAIFVALMFNVLFVFFSMAINVALVVHDKINLQNSVDLAAYYAASKQAELLNAMAHQNYAIRQSWKVLTWRYRALGTMGLNRNPIHPVVADEMTEQAWPPDNYPPAVCVAYKPNWAEVPPDESICHTYGLQVPPLPVVPVIAGFLGLNHGISELSKQLKAQYEAQCQKHGASNWWFAMSILHAFRLDQRNRKQVIYALADSVAGGQNGDFIDLDGNSVVQGARKVLEKNLTWANRQSLVDVKFMNSLEGLRRENWLPEVQIVPVMYYTDVTMPGGACTATPQLTSRLPELPESIDRLQLPWGPGLDATDLFPWAQSSTGFLNDSDYQFSMGVEKNPWYMVYMGVQATTRPRQIFFPIGGGVTTVARAFAKPFGGRMGPWYGADWPQGAPTSSGRAVDTLLPPRMVNGSLMNSMTGTGNLPNYSRFPGDTLGMRSKLALNSLEGLRGLPLSYDYYKNIKVDMESGRDNDILAWDYQANKAPLARFFELAIAAPDLFDTTYYSVEPNYTQNYLERLQQNKALFKIPFNVPVRGDLGARGSTVANFSVQEQMAAVAEKNIQKPQAFFYLRDKFHLLTAWLPGAGAFNYDLDSSFQNFGKCALPDDNLKFKNPGSCVAGGGRTGYSVKLIGRDALLAPLHKYGGGDSSANTILNPPRGEDGW